jgi:hypothetical protein
MLYEGKMSEIRRIQEIIRDNQKIIYFFLPLIILALIFPAAFTGERVFIGEYHDVLALEMPYLFLGDHLFSLWNNAWIGGFPDYASPVSDRYYPFSLPFYLATKDIFILNFVILLHIYIAFLAFYKFSSLFSGNRNLMLIFSFFYSLSGIMLSRVWAGHTLLVYALAWIPLVYYYFFRISLFQGNNARSILLFALSSVLLLFTGAVYYFFYTFLILLVYAVYLVFARKLPGTWMGAAVLALSLILLLSSVKVVPDLIASPYLQRIDPLNPLADGGSLENNIAAFATGTQIDTVFGWHESRALIGIIPIIFLVLGLVFGRKDFTFPSFFAILFAFLWADGGKTLLSFVHLLPVLNNFRNSGRIFGSLLPVLLVLALQGVLVAHSRMKSKEGFSPDDSQKKSIFFGFLFLAGLKLTELPFQGFPSWQAVLSLSLVGAFVWILYTGRMTGRILLLFLGGALLANLGALSLDYPLLQADSLLKTILIAAIISAVVLVSSRDIVHPPASFLCSLLLLGLFLSFGANLTYVGVFDPKLDASYGRPVLDAMADHPSMNIQPWIFENGWPVQHIDFTYWFIKNGSHPLRAYYSYLLKTVPFATYQIGNTTYFTPDYIVDTAYLENGQKNLPNSSFEAANISIIKPDNVLPNAFVIRDENVLSGRITRFSPDEVILEGNFRKGDVAVLKAAYYPGWTINGREASSLGNMPGVQLMEDTTEIRYAFAPFDFSLGIFLTCAGILLAAFLIWKRRDIDRYLAASPVKAERKAGKKKR